jgi:hypothetical protein
MLLLCLSRFPVVSQVGCGPPGLGICQPARQPERSTSPAWGSAGAKRSTHPVREGNPSPVREGEARGHPPSITDPALPGPWLVRREPMACPPRGMVSQAGRRTDRLLRPFNPAFNAALSTANIRFRHLPHHSARCPTFLTCELLSTVRSPRLPKRRTRSSGISCPRDLSTAVNPNQSDGPVHPRQPAPKAASGFASGFWLCLGARRPHGSAQRANSKRHKPGKV